MVKVNGYYCEVYDLEHKVCDNFNVLHCFIKYLALIEFYNYCCCYDSNHIFTSASILSLVYIKIMIDKVILISSN